MIFVVGIITSANLFIHYSFVSVHGEAQSFFLIEIFRFSLFFLVCYYFTSKASGLLPNKRFMMIVLKITFGITFLFIVAVGAIIMDGINNYLDNVSP
jgi:hypothetical protein